MSRTNLKEIIEETPVSLERLIDCAWDYLEGFQDWLISYLDLVGEFVEDEMAMDLIFEVLHGMKEHPKRKPIIGIKQMSRVRTFDMDAHKLRMMKEQRREV